MEVRITFDEVNVRDTQKINDIDIVMVKGEKGDTGYPTDAQVATAIDEWLTEHPEATTTVQDGSITEAKLSSDLSEELARVNGYYDELTAGSAEQLLSSQFVEDSVPYKFRTSGGSADIGKREYDEIVGGSIVWNQLVQSAVLPNTQTKTGITFTNNGDGSITVNGTNTGSSSAIFYFSQFASPVPVGHKMLLLGASGMSWGNTFTIWDTQTGSFSSVGQSGGVVYNKTAEATILGVAVWSGQTVNNVKFYPQLFDLTQMFGSQVADYIYQLEQAQSGKGVAFFKSLFPNDYYPYNAGELMSVEGLQSHDMVGFNQWDEEWQLGYINPTTGDYSPRSDRICSKNYIPVLPDTAYYFEDPSPTYMTAVWYDENKARIRNNSPHNEVITSPSNARYLRFSMPSEYGTTYKNDICINLSWSGWRNGEYEEYKKHSYALDSTLTLRGIPKIVDSKFCYDGDGYKYTGKVNRRYGVVDLGSLNWTYYTSGTNPIFYAGPTNARAYNRGEEVHAINSKYAVSSVATERAVIVESLADKSCSWMYGANGSFTVRDSSYTSASAFKTAMSGVMLIYELATPTEETAEPFDEIQLVDDFGTEEYVSGNLVPVGHNTKYPANLRDKLQHLPDLPSGDGYYLIQVSGTQMTLNPFRIPVMPTTDGTYTLKCTVSGGTPTASWESEETE